MQNTKEQSLCVPLCWKSAQRTVPLCCPLMLSCAVALVQDSIPLYNNDREHMVMVKCFFSMFYPVHLVVFNAIDWILRG